MHILNHIIKIECRYVVETSMCVTKRKRTVQYEGLLKYGTKKKKLAHNCTYFKTNTEVSNEIKITSVIEKINVHK